MEDGGLRGDCVQRLITSMRGPSGEDGDGTQDSLLGFVYGMPKSKDDVE